jgi:hypothetical protein
MTHVVRKITARAADVKTQNVDFVETGFTGQVKFVILPINNNNNNNLSVVLVRKRTILTERPQPVGEVSANFS